MNSSESNTEHGETLTPLSGLRVLRLGHSLAGDLLCRILSDAGASIIFARDIEYDVHEAQPFPAAVVINDLGRGVVAPSGLDYASLAVLKPALTYCSLVSFPEGGPEGLPELEDDPIMAVLGLNRINGGSPEHEPLRMPSLYGALLAAIYIAAAQLQVSESHEPRFIEVPLFSAALNVLGRPLVRFDDTRLTDPLTTHYILPVSALRECADGRYIQPHGMFPHFVKILFEVGGHPEWADEAAAGLFDLPDAQSVELWNSRMDEMFLARTAADWEKAISAAGGACTMCRSTEEWRLEQQPYHEGVFVEKKELSTSVGPGFTLRADLRKIQSVPVARSSGGTRKGPLTGVKVVDFCIIIAGPTVGRILADLGADVVKVDAPNRIPNPFLWMDVNRGKRSIVLDMTHAEARDVAMRLVADSDVVIENFRKGKLAAFGLGYEDTFRDNPGIVYASVNAFGQAGPWGNRPGWEHNAQAASGMQWARSANGVPRQVPFPVNDYATGLFGALGIILGLIHKRHNGVGARVSASLARSATVLQEYLCFAGRAASTGDSLSLETVCCSDGWVTAYLAANTSPLPATLRDMAARTNVVEAQKLLSAAGFAAAVESSPVELTHQAWLQRAGLLQPWTHPFYGRLVQSFPHGSFAGETHQPRHPAPSPGADNLAVLEGMGQSGQYEALKELGAIQTFPLFRGVK